MQYFPDYTKKKIPEKKYMINVLNTLLPGSMRNLMMDMRKKKAC